MGLGVEYLKPVLSHLVLQGEGGRVRVHFMSQQTKYLHSFRRFIIFTDDKSKLEPWIIMHTNIIRAFKMMIVLRCLSRVKNLPPTVLSDS